jgi:hypothetical protein
VVTRTAASEGEAAVSPSRGEVAAPTEEARKRRHLTTLLSRRDALPEVEPLAEEELAALLGELPE